MIVTVCEDGEGTPMWRCFQWAIGTAIGPNSSIKWKRSELLLARERSADKGS